MSTYMHHEARPDELVYLDHDFHIMDLQVIMNNEIDVTFTLFILLLALPVSFNPVWINR